MRLYCYCISSGNGCNVIVVMPSATVRVMICIPVQFVADRLPKIVLSSILGFHALTGRDT